MIMVRGERETKMYGTDEVEKYADPKNWELWDAPKGCEVLYQTFPEFTCLCPRSGYPDFATVHLVTIPNKKVLEMKNLKMWFNSFRNVGISHENATETIMQTLVDTLGLDYAFVLMEYTPRGNLTTFPMREYSSGSEREGVADALVNARQIKQELIIRMIQKQVNR